VARRERQLLLLASVFIVFGAITLHLAYAPFTLSALSFVVLSFVISFSAAHFTLSRHLPQRDPLLLPVAGLLSGWGLLTIGRLAPNFLPRQTTWLLISTLAMLAVALVGRGLRWLRRFRYTWLLAGLALLAATLLFGVNPSGYGPRLWLRLGGVFFQPSEPLKLLMVVYLASYLAERRGLILTTRRSRGFRLPPLAYAGPLVVMFGFTTLLLAGQQDLGAAMLFFFTFLAMFYLATGQWEVVVVGLLLFAAAGLGGYLVSARLASRVDGWLNPWPDAADRAFQIVQSLIAVGAGGVGGAGLGLGRPTYIPAVHTDFVFASIAEEFGLAGTLVVVALYSIVLLRGLRIAARARRPFERLLAGGLTAGLVIQALIIMAANVKLIPISGVTLPFLSYGGSSLLSTFIALGLLLRISSTETEDRRVSTAPSVDRTAMWPQLLRLGGVLGMALAVLAATCGYWGVARADWLVAREDNPRRVEYEQRILRGRIEDRDGVVLADVEIAPSGIVSRTYPVPEAAPVLGYASLRYGTGGIEAAFDDVLRGESDRTAWRAALDDWLHRAPVGQELQLTVDVELQRAAQRALEGQRGAVVLLNAETGEVLALVSAPTFDPALLDAAWDELREDPAAPLFNRATQGLYQPGAALETVILGEVLESNIVAATDHAESLTDTVPVNGEVVGCLQTPPSSDLLGAYAAACPGPFAALGEQMGEDGVLAAAERWGLTEAPPVEVPTESAEWAFGQPELEAMGQGGLTVSPFQMALVAAVLANDGTMPAPGLVLRVSDQGGWHGLEPQGIPRAVISVDTARAFLLALESFDGGVLGHLSTAVAGEDQAPHAWFIGVAPSGAPRYAIAVLLEHPADPHRAAEIGAMLLHEAAR
jgi:cell division protein FtsW (lipid II flippase)/cell division protein FtsI/penicillin-binding protein 2